MEYVTRNVAALNGTVNLCALKRCRSSIRRKRSRHIGHTAALIVALVGMSLASVARSQAITEFPIPHPMSEPFRIAAGPDGNLWFTELQGNRIGRITTAGVVTEFHIPTAGSGPYNIAVGPDGNLWFAEEGGNQIGRITTAGVISEFPIPTAFSGASGIAAGPDGNLWFTEKNVPGQIGRITTAGVVTEFPIPTAGGEPTHITTGPDGNLWFTEEGGNRIGRITTAGVVTEFPLPTINSSPYGIAVGPDGNIWFAEIGLNVPKIGRITTAGVISEFPIPTPFSGPTGIAAGPDGNLWFTEQVATQIGRITTAGVITEFPVPTAHSSPSDIAAGPDGNLWFTESIAGQIGRITTRRLTPKLIAVDTRKAPGSSSNMNGVLEPGETVEVAPSWRNRRATSQTFTGAAADLTGPLGPTYALLDNHADYGTVAGNASVNCHASGDCYVMAVSGARPTAHWDATFTESLSVGSIAKTWTLHVGESFPDVPTSHPFYASIENVFHNGIDGGCGGGNYCPTDPVTRGLLAVLLMKSLLGPAEIPPPATGTVFADVPASDPLAPWVEQVAGFQIVGGCGNGNYCPNDSVTRADMAVFLLKAEHGSAYIPPPCSVSIFADVTCPSTFADWIEQIFHEGIMGGCGNGNYCPGTAVNRGHMAIFLVKTFRLRLYGP